jgi:diacylglycerol diphosphate phosphatase/phosphatidate phosphatase
VRAKPCEAVSTDVPLAWVATDAFKLTVGRPRPDVIDRCRPAEGSANGAVFGLVTSAICTRTDLLKDGFRSFPSGHASCKSASGSL